MSLAIITTADRFGLLSPCKATEAFETGCLKSSLSAASIHDATKPISLPDTTTHVLILGPKALSITHPGRDIDKFRGTLTTLYDKFAMVSYHPTDAQDQTSGDTEEPTYDEDSSDEKDSARTQPANYFFWIKRDTEKLLYTKYLDHPPLKYVAAPNLEKFIAYANNYLQTAADPIVYLDIECRREDHVINCIGLAYGDSPVFVIPFYFWNNTKAYGDLYKVLVLLSRSFLTATVVVHNALFDLFILSRYYRILVGHKIYDTMLAHHRCFPEVEKSLGHVVSYWTYLPYHKDLAIENPRNPNQQGQLWEYNAKDVYAMREVYKQQKLYVMSGTGLEASVAQANNSVYKYLIAMLRGLPVDELALMAAKLAHTKKARMLKAICRILSGDSMFNPGSSDQCVNYFHKKLHYESVARTDGGKEKMDQKSLYRLRLKYSNPLLDAVIAYRIVAKENSMLNFIDYAPPSFKNS